MTDILGPADAPNAVTVRPAETRSFGTVDSWFRDCSTPTAEDGTDFQASFLNGIAGVLRSVWRMNGKKADNVTAIIPEVGTDDDGLSKSLQHLVQRGQPRFGIDAGAASAMVVTLAPALAEYKKGVSIIVTVGNVPTGATTINCNGLGTRAVLRRSGIPLQANDLVAGASYELIDDGTAFRLAGLAEGEVARSPVFSTLWVRTDGDDSHDGSANDAAHAFKTIQAAIDNVTRNFVLSGRTITIRLGNAGTYAAFAVSPTPGTLVVQGDAAAQDSYIIAGNGSSNGSGLIVSNGATLSLVGVAASILNNVTNLIAAQYAGNIFLQNVTLGGTSANPFAALCAFAGSTITVGVGCKCTASFGTLFAATGGNINATGGTFTLTGGPNFANGTARASVQGSVTFNGTVFSGSAVGPRYNADFNGVILSFGGGVNYFPGSSAGSVSTGGQYGV